MTGSDILSAKNEKLYDSKTGEPIVNFCENPYCSEFHKKIGKNTNDNFCEICGFPLKKDKNSQKGQNKGNGNYENNQQKKKLEDYFSIFKLDSDEFKKIIHNTVKNSLISGPTLYLVIAFGSAFLKYMNKLNSLLSALFYALLYTLSNCFDLIYTFLICLFIFIIFFYLNNVSNKSNKKRNPK